MSDLIKTVIDGRAPCLANQFTDAVYILIDRKSSKDEKLRAVHSLAELCNATILEPEDDEQEIEFADYSFISLDPLEEEAEDEKAMAKA